MGLEIPGGKLLIIDVDGKEVSVIKTGNKETLNSSYNTTVIATSEDLVWLKAEPGTCFIVKK